MVLLTYQDEGISRGSASPSKDAAVKSECPKTPYIDKLYTFNEEYAEEEKCDMFFICQDGEIPAHRLVISHASKYIMAMQDDQPPWYPVYISVPDLTKEIVNTLVRLAYTGQMTIPPGTTSDELLDAMQALGWVHTDCLTSSYLDSSSASAEEEFAVPVSSKTAESLETVLKMNFPVTTKGETETSDDEDEMEMAVPDVPLSDEDEGRLQIVEDPKTKGEGSKKRTRQTKQPKAKTPAKSKVTTPVKRGQSPKPKRTAEASKPKKVEESASNARKSSRRSDGDAVSTSNTTPSKDVQVEVSTNSADAPSEPLRSRTRTIRKPKKFDDLIVMTPTKRKESPSKSPSKPAPKNSKANEVEKEAIEAPKTSKRAIVDKKTSNDLTPVAVTSKDRRSTSEESKDAIRNSLITSFFQKRGPRKSNDTTEKEETNDCASEVSEANGPNDNDKGGVSKKESTTTDNKEDNVNNTAPGRNRAKSTASNKSDKEIPTDDGNNEAETSPNTRRKRSIQDNSVAESTEPANPAKRGRKASTMSNASKASNKEPVPENDVDDVADTSRKRRSRQE